MDKHVAVSLPVTGTSSSLSLSKDPLRPLPASLLETKDLSPPLGHALQKFTPVSTRKTLKRPHLSGSACVLSHIPDYT